MTQNRYFQQCACVNVICFAPVVTTTYRVKNNKSSTRGMSLELGVLARARAQLLNMLYISTHMSVPHGQNIYKTSYTPISKNVVGKNGEWQLSNDNCTTIWYAKTICSSRGAKLGSTTTATKPPQICIFVNEKQYFCTCIFHLLTF